MNNSVEDDIMVDLSKITKFPILKDNKILIKSKTKKDLKVNKNLILKKDFLRDLYITFGDGSFHKGVYLSNINYRLHKNFIKTFSNYFDIKKKDFIISLSINNKFSRNEINKAKSFWIKVLDLMDINRFYFTNFNTCFHGNVKVIYDNKQLSILLNKIISHINNLIFSNKLNQTHLCFILDGILNAEGGASIDKDRWGLHKITISFNNYNKEEIKLFFNILCKLDLKNVIKLSQGRRYEISKWYNLYKLIKVFVKNNVMPFSLSSKRAIKLLWGFLNHQRTKSIYKYLKAINKKENQTIRELNKYLIYDRSSVEEALLRKFNQFRFFNINKSIRPYKVSITNEGKFFLMLIKKLNLWLNKAENMYFKDLNLLREAGMEEDLLPFERIKRKLFIKKESETNWNYGKEPNKRGIEELIDYGIINLNKPSGPTSHQVSDYVQKILSINKAGHSGTLVK